MQSVGDALDYTGWKWIHHRPARRANGKWTTPTQGNSSRGFPDLIAVRPPRMLAIELKRKGGRVTPEQKEWISDLAACGVEAHILWMPRDWHTFDALVQRPPVQETLSMSTGRGATYTIAEE
jgi:hypothetical protein